MITTGSAFSLSAEIIVIVGYDVDWPKNVSSHYDVYFLWSVCYLGIDVIVGLLKKYPIRKIPDKC